jgi:hypothetical protein
LQRLLAPEVRQSIGIDITGTSLSVSISFTLTEFNIAPTVLLAHIEVVVQMSSLELQKMLTKRNERLMSIR